MKTKKQFEQVLLGSLLGDASLVIPLNKKYDKRYGNPYFTEAHSLKQENYLLHKQSIFKENGFDINLKYGQTKLKINNKKYPKLTLRTTSKSEFMPIYQDLYPNHKKVINLNILSKLNWLGIAVWYCDDGGYNYRSKSVYFSHSKGCQSELIKYFDMLGFNFKPSKNCIRLGVEQSKLFIQKIQSYVLEMPKCIHYKLGTNQEKIRIAEEKNKKGHTNHYYKNWELSKQKRRQWVYQNKQLANTTARRWAISNPDKMAKIGKRFRLKHKKEIAERKRIEYYNELLTQ